MKSYIQGLITGAVLVFAIVVLFGARTEPVGRYAPMSTQHVVDTVTGDIIVATMSESHLATAKKEIVRLRVIMPE